MKSLLLAIFPFLMVMCAVFYGCTALSSSDNVYPKSCYFANSTPVMLIKDTLSSETNVNLIVEGEDVNVNPDIQWDTDVIDYNITTGDITAVGVGSTYITVSYYTSAYHTEERSLYVSVSAPVFAESIGLEENYLLKNSPSQYTVTPVIVTEEGNYNLPVVFMSGNEDIFTVDDEGMISPTGTGTAFLTVKAVSGYNSETHSYTYLTQTATVTSESFFTDLKLELYSSTKLKLSAESGVYGLSCGTPEGEETATFYYAKITSDYSLKDAEIVPDADSSVSVNLYESDGAKVEYSGDYTQVFIPVRMTAGGECSLSFTLVDRSALNTEISLKTNTLLINSHTYITSQNFAVKTYAEILESSADYALLTEDFTDIETDGETGFNLLYALGGDDLAKAEGHKAGNYYFALIIFDNPDDYCYNKFTISYNSNNIFLTGITDGLYYVQADGVGTGYVSIRADDGGNWSGDLYFEVLEVPATAYGFYAEEKIYLVKDETVTLTQKINPSYATYSYEITPYYTGSAILEFIGESTVKATARGNCLVEVRLGEEIVTYSISVSSCGCSISVDCLTYTIERGDGINVAYRVLDADGITSTSQTVKVIFLADDGTESAVSAFVNVDFASESFYFEWKKSGEVKFRFELIEQGTVIDYTEVITITCK